ncbi:uncharacterized protein HMPREF1541_05948 [Cyphellophora europaea CBS 101466]|uniref:Uncharacterized protein n=1 Tax=Cyphellophora europaea (strain CBS 101466) TaxID=1220924 RepID=W2RTE1_CYPE1|nr:uncharacterized protein HMPREF1541_05948 [Cyphellophora europaea CBS 101466]ETN39722.1 hypothetical protein HMPREF1541_05948 [Cyphellophora europaea CBS 101466]
MAALVQTIAIVDKSNKVVGTTKQLKNVFKEAKIAYLERKAEIVADRKAKEDRELHKARKHVEAMTIADDASVASSRRSHRSHDSPRRHHPSRRHAHYESDEDDYDRHRERRHRPSAREHRHKSSASVRSGYTTSTRSSFDSSPRSTHSRSRSISQSPRTRHLSLGQFNDDLAVHRSAPASPTGHELQRRRTDGLALQTKDRRPSVGHRSHSATDIDMDLAYGEFHPSSLERLSLDPATEQKLQKQELTTLVARAKGLLDEANCAQHSVKAIVAHLQKNPDAMAAVALTLAEISSLASKMAPAALASMKTAAPAVFALLASPQFLIAVGVGVGVTVVAIGGYKIIKKIQSGKEGKEGSMDEMLEVKELDRIEHWRRGIADAGDDAYEGSVVSGTSVEGEFITPMAARSMGHLPPQPESRKDKKERKKEERKREKDEKKEQKRIKSKSGSIRSDGGSVSSTGSKHKSSRVEELVRGKDVVKKPSPLRRMFTSKDTNSSVAS